MDTLLSTFRPSDALNNGFMAHASGDLENVHRDAKHMICMYLVEPIREMFDNMYRIVIAKGGSLKDFQKTLQAIPKWNVNVLDEHCQAIRSRCEGLSDIVSALFLERIKVLSVLRVSSDDSPVSIKIPSETRFCHRVFEKCAEEFYANPFMFRRNNDHAKTQIILAAIDHTVQRLLPIKDVLAIYMKPGNVSSDDAEKIRHIPDEEVVNDGADKSPRAAPMDVDGLAKLSAHNVNVTKLDVPEFDKPASPGQQENQYFAKHDFAEDDDAWKEQVAHSPKALDVSYPQLVHAGREGGGHEHHPQQDVFLFDRGNDDDLEHISGE